MSQAQATTTLKDDKNVRKSFNIAVRKPGDMRPDIQTKAQIVLRILEECITKVKISMLMPTIINKSNMICELLKNTAYENCAKLLEEFIVDFKKGSTSFQAKCHKKHFCNQKLIKVIDAFHEHYNVLPIIEEAFLATATDLDRAIFLPRYDVVCLIEAMNTLHETAVQQMYKSARDELLLEKRIHLFYHENKNIQNDIQKFQHKIMRSKNALRWRIAAKEGIVAQIEEELDEVRLNNEMIFHLEEKDAAKKLQSAQISYQQRRRELLEEVDRAAESMAKTYKTNYTDEQNVRAERNKLLIQLQTLTKRYDNVMGEKFKYNMILNKQLAALQQEFNEFLKNEYEKAEKVYTDIVRAAELKKQREFEMKLALFVGNRAAKIIQRAWKKYMKAVREERGETVATKPKGKKKK